MRAEVQSTAVTGGGEPAAATKKKKKKKNKKGKETKCHICLQMYGSQVGHRTLIQVMITDMQLRRLLFPDVLRTD